MPKPNPKGLTAFESRLSAVHTYLLSTQTAHTLKDLEKTLPSAVQGLTSMNTKDHIQSLVDEGLLRMEKIGTGNWYWSFASDARIQREQVKSQISTERDAVLSRLEILRSEFAKWKDETTTEDEDERVRCQDAIAVLRQEIDVVRCELAPLEGDDPVTLQAKREEIRQWKYETDVWTDNCCVLEAWMRDCFGLGLEERNDVLRECYGDEFAEGGLVELE